MQAANQNDSSSNYELPVTESHNFTAHDLLCISKNFMHAYHSFQNVVIFCFYHNNKENIYRFISQFISTQGLRISRVKY